MLDQLYQSDLFDLFIHYNTYYSSKTSEILAPRKDLLALLATMFALLTLMFVSFAHVLIHKKVGTYLIIVEGKILA